MAISAQAGRCKAVLELDDHHEQMPMADTWSHTRRNRPLRWMSAAHDRQVATPFSADGQHQKVVSTLRAKLVAVAAVETFTCSPHRVRPW